MRFEVDAWCGGEVEGASGFEGAGGLEIGAVQRSGDVLTDFMKLSLGEGPSSKTPDYNQEVETGQEPEDMLRKQEHLLVDEPKGRETSAVKAHSRHTARSPWALFYSGGDQNEEKEGEACRNTATTVVWPDTASASCYA